MAYLYYHHHLDYYNFHSIKYYPPFKAHLHKTIHLSLPNLRYLAINSQVIAILSIDLSVILIKIIIKAAIAEFEFINIISFKAANIITAFEIFNLLFL